MSDEPIDDALRHRLSELGRKGGQTMSTDRRHALAMARERKAFYRRNPSQHPSRRQPQSGQQEPSDGH